MFIIDAIMMVWSIHCVFGEEQFPLCFFRKCWPLYISDILNRDSSLSLSLSLYFFHSFAVLPFVYLSFLFRHLFTKVILCYIKFVLRWLTANCFLNSSTLCYPHCVFVSHSVCACENKTKTKLNKTKRKRTTTKKREQNNKNTHTKKINKWKKQNQNRQR